MRRYIPIVGILVFFLFLLSGSASGSAQLCRTIEAQITIGERYGFSGRLLDPGQRERFLAAYNAMEPVSDEQPEHVWFFAHFDGEQAAVAFVDGVCVVNFGIWQLRQIEDMARDGLNRPT